MPCFGKCVWNLFERGISGSLYPPPPLQIHSLTDFNDRNAFSPLTTISDHDEYYDHLHATLHVYLSRGRTGIRLRSTYRQAVHLEQLGACS